MTGETCALCRVGFKGEHEHLATLADFQRALERILGRPLCAADLCNKPIPPGKRADSRYCSRRCKARMYQRRAREGRK